MMLRLPRIPPRVENFRRERRRELEELPSILIESHTRGRSSGLKKRHGLAFLDLLGLGPQLLSILILTYLFQQVSPVAHIADQLCRTVRSQGLPHITRRLQLPDGAGIVP